MAIGNSCGRRSVVQEDELIIHELDVRRLGGSLAVALGLDEAFNPCVSVHQTWRLGFQTGYGRPLPVYLSIQRSADGLRRALMHFALNPRGPFVLLLPTASMLDECGLRMLEHARSVWIALDRCVSLSHDGQFAASIDVGRWAFRMRDEPVSPSASAGLPDENGQLVLARREMPDGVHWFVDGEDKGIFFRNPSAIKARIIEILFEQTGRGWVPHRTFVHACGWPPGRYFGDPSETRIIQKHLTDIRNFLGVEVIFRKDKGVRFTGNVVKSGE